MANAFPTPDIIAREAQAILENNTVALPLFRTRSHEAEFTGNEKVGDTIKVRVPATVPASEFTGTTSTTEVSEDTVDLTVEKHFYTQIEITSKERSMELQDLAEQVILPVMVGITDEVDSYLLSKLKDVNQYFGTPGDPPDSVADIADLRKRMADAKIPLRGRRAVMNTQAEADLFKIEAFHSAEKRGDGGVALREASLGRVMGFDWYMDQNVPDHTTGTWEADSGTVAVDGLVAAGATTLTVQTATANATVKTGDVFRVGGNDYVVTADVTLSAGGAGDIDFLPAAPTGGIADDAVITVPGDHVPNVAFAPGAFTAVAFPPALPDGARAAVMYRDGLGIRVVYDWNSSTLKDVIHFDTYVGAALIHREKAVRFLG